METSSGGNSFQGFGNCLSDAYKLYRDSSRLQGWLDFAKRMAEVGSTNAQSEAELCKKQKARRNLLEARRPIDKLGATSWRRIRTRAQGRSREDLVRRWPSVAASISEHPPVRHLRRRKASRRNSCSGGLCGSCRVPQHQCVPAKRVGMEWIGIR